jgi:hypothetical protein
VGIWPLRGLQGDVVGCFLHLPEGGRSLERSKAVSRCHNALSPHHYYLSPRRSHQSPWRHGFAGYQRFRRLPSCLMG